MIEKTSQCTLKTTDARYTKPLLVRRGEEKAVDTEEGKVKSEKRISPSFIFSRTKVKMKIEKRKDNGDGKCGRRTDAIFAHCKFSTIFETICQNLYEFESQPHVALKYVFISPISILFLTLFRTV